MARVIGAEDAEMRSVRRQPLRRYHWLIMLLSVVAALAVSLPTLLSQPAVYRTSAEVTIDPQRYSSFFATECSEPGAGERGVCLNDAYQQEALAPTLAILRRTFYGFDTRYVKLISKELPGGRVQLTALALNATRAHEIAEEGAFLITQRIRAAVGRELLRQQMGHQLYLMYHDQPPAGDFDREIRELLVERVFNIVPEAISSRPQLSAEDLNDIIRALEVRDVELGLRLQDPEVTEYARQRATQAQQTLREFLIDYQDDEHRLPETEPSAAYISGQAALPAAPLPQYLLLKTALVLLAGLASGVLTVSVDRSMGIISKLRELWSYRELIGSLVARDLKARYKGSVLGYLWSLMNPLMMTGIFYIVFSVLLRSNITYFHIFLMTALLPWNFCAGAIMEGMGSVVSNAALVKKVYFPREILPISAVLSNLVSFCLGLPVLFLVILATGASLSWSALFLPVIIILQTIFMAGVVLVLSASAVFFRDTQHIMGVLLQLWFFMTPIFYALEDVVPSLAKYVRWFNPMASLVDFYRDILYGGVAVNGALPTPGLPALDGVARTALTVLVVLGIGVYVFHRMSGRFGEEL